MATHDVIFEGFKREIESEGVGGAQKKDKYSGRYIHIKTGKRYYIKRSLKYRADDIMEVVSSKMLTILIGESLAVPYTFIKNQVDNSIYVCSEIRENATTLKAKVGKLPDIRALGANPMTQSNKSKIDETFTPEQRRQCAEILCACLLLKDYDVQIGNLTLYGKDQNKIAKFDNGWALSGICKDKARRVDLFGRRTLVGRSGTHGFAPIPTNHFNDYLLVDSDEFIKGMQTVIQRNMEKMQREITNVVAEVEKTYESDPRNALLDFAEHIGLMAKDNKVKINFTSMSTNDIRDLIVEKLQNRAQQRIHSMKVLKVLLGMKLVLKKMPPDKSKLTNLIRELKRQIEENYTQKNGYDPDETLRDVLPKFKPPRAKLFKAILDAARKQGVSQDEIAFMESISNLDTPLRNIGKLAKQEAPPTSRALLFGKTPPKITVATGIGKILDKERWHRLKKIFEQNTSIKVTDISTTAIQVQGLETQTRIDNYPDRLEVSSTKALKRMTPVDYEDMALRFRQAATITEHATCVLQNVKDPKILSTLVQGLLRDDAAYTGLRKIIPDLDDAQKALLKQTPEVFSLYNNAVKQKKGQRLW